MISADEFRAALSRWTSGVTIVTSRAGDTIHGMTVSDFCGVSLDPPLVMVCADKSSNTYRVIADGGCFGVNILAKGQEALSNRFASKKEEHRRFDNLHFSEADTGAPLIDDTLANLDCKLVATHDAGDHVIYVGEVMKVVRRDLEPLVYFDGRYQELAEAKA